MRNLLLFSDVVPDGDYKNDWFRHGEFEISVAFRGVEEVALFDYAMPKAIGELTEKFRDAFSRLGIKIVALHEHPGEEGEIIEETGGLIIGGGENGLTAASIDGLRHETSGKRITDRRFINKKSLRKPISEAIISGKPVLGVSAGAMALGQSYRAGNPDKKHRVQKLQDGSSRSIVENAQGLKAVSFDFSPHLPGDKREDRERRDEKIERLKSTATETGNPILALHNESFLRIRGSIGSLMGKGGGAVWIKPMKKTHYELPENFSIGALLLT